MPLTRIRQTAIGNDSITTAKLDDTSGGLTLPGVQYVRVPVGSGAQRPTGASGYLRFNTDAGVLEQWNTNTNSWAAVDSPPIITQVSYPGSVTAADPAGGETITLTGSNFQTGAAVTIGGTTATSVSVVSTTSITFTTPAKTAGDYDVVVTNTNGLAATSTNGISYNGTPSFTTAAGNVGSISEDVAMSTITIVAAEPDGGTLAYSITSGALPTGVSMSSAGAITGTPNINPTSNTTFNFTVTATDDENQTNSRAFNLIVLRPIYARQISNSLRFDGTSSYLMKTESATPTSTTQTTFSAWVKRSNLGQGHIWTAYNSNVAGYIYYNTDDQLIVYLDKSSAGSDELNVTTDARYKDTSDWYHILVKYDVGQAANSDKVKIYVNGTLQSATYSQTGSAVDAHRLLSSGTVNRIGQSFNGSSWFDGYMSDLYVIDGQVKEPTDFAEEFNGVWCPIAYSGTYGTNGFKLDFSDSSDLGKDSSQDYTLVTDGSATYGGGTTNFTSPEDAFDGLTSTGMNRSGTSGIIEITPTSAVTPIYHQITNTNSAAYTDASRPQNVQLEGSNDGGSTWTVIDTITQTPTGEEAVTSSLFSNSTSYTKLRLNITSNNGGTNTRFSEYKIISSESGGLGINNFTANGLSAQDSVIDSPTGNFNTMNYNRRYYDWVAQGQVVTLSNGGLTGNVPNAGAAIDSTMGFNSGKWYWEMRYDSGNWLPGLGLGRMGKTGAGAKYRFASNGTFSTYTVENHGNDYTGTNSASGQWTITTGDVLGIALDIDNLTINVYANGTLAYTETGIYDPKDDNDFYTVSFTNAAAGQITFNFGQDPTFNGQETAPGTDKTDGNNRGKFFHDVPSGYLAMCAANIAESTIDTRVDDRPEDYMNTVLTSGDGSNATVSGFGFQPDFIWHKSRTSSNNHQLMDSLRIDGSGDSFTLNSNATTAEGTSAAATLNSDGFVHLNGSSNNFNGNGNTYVSWGWKAGGAPTASNVATSGAMTANSVSVDGTLQSAYTPSGSPTLYPTKMSVNTKAGFSIVSWTGDGTAGRTLPHGLNEKPEFFILRGLDARAWATYHEQYVNYPNTGNYYAQLNGTNPSVDNAMFNSTAPTADLFTVGSYNVVNAVNYIGYFWHSVPGYSHIGEWRNVAEALGTYIYCGFKPAWLLIRCTDAAENWYIQDNKRSPTNYTTGGGTFLMPDIANSEGAHSATTAAVDFVANGFKIRTSNTGSGEVSYSSRKYAFMAFAEDPFKYAEAR